MHQQVRTKTTKTGSDGPGAAHDQGGLVDILTVLRDEDINLRAAGGRDLDRDGEFVFAVHHGDGPDDGPAEAAAKVLRDHGYRPRVVTVHECLVDDTPGSLLRCIEEAEAKDGDVFEIFVGTPAKDGRIPLEITTRRAVQGNAAR